VRHHVILFVRVGAGRPLEALSSCGTGQSGAPLIFCSDFCRVYYSALFTVTVDRCAEIAVAPLAHRTVRWRTGQSGGAPDSPVAHRTAMNYSGAAPRKPEAEEFEVDPPWCTRNCPMVHQTLSGGTPDSPVRQTREHFGFLCSFLLEPFLIFVLVLS
jgi:hypothetical protein